ncbi:MAG: alpha-mannosidase, partial [Clostridia bacterium]|nr:alpha-mannosidase [Clostridia bacterium]
MEKGKNKIFCVISHTHWDREWYMPLENFRHRLTDLMDRLLEILSKDPSYIFHLDAQTVVLEDYLLVRPEKKNDLIRYIRNRRIVIGPWYLQNDFYLTSGEATVRNLLEGARLAGEFGGSSRVGYAADQFGNPSQLPQILKDFGLSSFVFGRGFARYDLDADGKPVPKKTPTEFVWRGADGTEIPAIHMRHWYNNAQRFSADVEKALGYLKLIEKSFDDEFTLTPYLLLMNGV